MSKWKEVDGVLRVEPGVRVRFAAITPTHDSEGARHEVVRVRTRAGEPVDSRGPGIMVVLRHSLTWRNVLAAIAFAGDQPMSGVLRRVIAKHRKTRIDRDSLPSVFLGDRGRPSTDSERTLNLVVERDTEMAGAYTADLVGEYCDQAYFLKQGDIDALEQMARAHELEPGQVVDVLVMKELAEIARG